MASTKMGAASPTSSPRLPSPPPFPEVQLPPKSPGMPAAPGPANADPSKQGAQDLRRIRPGTKAADMASGPPLVPLSELDSPFQLQEHLKSLHTHHTRSDTDPNSTIPITHRTALTIARPPQNVDRSLWLYELTRFLVMRANDLIVSFFRESPPCSATTCPEMRASEWQYLCAVHEPPKPCCAIDYSCHTLDWAAYMLTSQKHFPSRLTLGSETSGGMQQGVRQLTNIMRRVYRIFAHAWFQHRGVFWDVEGREGLYVLFKTVCDVYGLIPEENYTIPREAEGLEDEQRERPQSPAPKSHTGEGETEAGDDDRTMLTTGPGATQRRHKATPSVGSAVTTIAEGDEDDKGSESPTKHAFKEAANHLSKTQPHVGHPDGPVTPISKIAEKDEPTAEVTAGAPVTNVEKNSNDLVDDDINLKGSSKQETHTHKSSEGLQRTISSDSTVTMVKVEEKGVDDE